MKFVLLCAPLLAAAMGLPSCCLDHDDPHLYQTERTGPPFHEDPKMYPADCRDPAVVMVADAK